MTGAFLNDIVTIAGPALAALGGAASGIRFVQEGERAIRLRFERAVKKGGSYVVVSPGFRWMIPGVHKLERTHIRQRTLELAKQTIILKDRTVFEVGAVLVCSVKDTPDDLYKALFESDNLNRALKNIGATVVRNVVRELESDAMYGEDTGGIGEKLVASISDRAAELGVQVHSFELTQCDPADGTTQLLQTKAMVAFKLGALTDAAETMGVTVQEMPKGLAAVLLGSSLVASASVEDD